MLYQVGASYADTPVALRLEGHLTRAIADGALAGTWPCPVTTESRLDVKGARTAASPLPPAARVGRQLLGKR